VSCEIVNDDVRTVYTALVIVCTKI